MSFLSLPEADRVRLWMRNGSQKISSDWNLALVTAKGKMVEHIGNLPSADDIDLIVGSCSIFNCDETPQEVVWPKVVKKLQTLSNLPEAEGFYKSMRTWRQQSLTSRILPYETSPMYAAFRKAHESAITLGKRRQEATNAAGAPLPKK